MGWKMAQVASPGVPNPEPEANELSFVQVALRYYKFKTGYIANIEKKTHWTSRSHGYVSRKKDTNSLNNHSETEWNKAYQTHPNLQLTVVSYSSYHISSFGWLGYSQQTSGSIHETSSHMSNKTQSKFWTNKSYLFGKAWHKQACNIMQPSVESNKKRQPEYRILKHPNHQGHSFAGSKAVIDAYRCHIQLEQGDCFRPADLLTFSNHKDFRWLQSYSHCLGQSMPRHRGAKHSILWWSQLKPNQWAIQKWRSCQRPNTPKPECVLFSNMRRPVTMLQSC